MSDDKHTQGPWEVADAGGYHGDKYVLAEYFVRRPEDDVAIASEILDPDTDRPSKANAQLIAAAPDMLEALQALEEYTRGCVHTIGERDKAARIISAVIQKAIGQP